MGALSGRQRPESSSPERRRHRDYKHEHSDRGHRRTTEEDEHRYAVRTAVDHKRHQEERDTLAGYREAERGHEDRTHRRRGLDDDMHRYGPRDHEVNLPPELFPSLRR